ncbi:MAG: ROK family protein, partial [Acidimicrobiia bacterium]
MPPRLALAVDIGGTKLAAGIVDGEGGRLLDRAATPTPVTDDADVVFSALTGLLDKLLPVEAAVCGIGCGGPMAPGGEEVSTLHIPAFRRFPLRRRVAEATGLATFVDNDAKALARGEG